MDLKTTLVIRKKNKIVKKLEEKSGEGIEENKDEEKDDEKEEEEDIPTQALLALTQGQGEDQEEK